MFVSVPMSSEDEQEAKRIRARRDRLYRSWFVIPEKDTRWVGDIGEIGFNRWACSVMGPARVTWKIEDVTGGKPDFIVAKRTLDVKTVACSSAPQIEYTAQVMAKDRYLHEKVSYFFFARYEIKVSLLWLLGGIARTEFLEKARYFSAGEKVHAYYTVQPGREIYNIEIARLTPPAELLNGWVFEDDNEQCYRDSLLDYPAQEPEP